MTLSGKAAELLRLHLDPELLVLVNVWDVISATTVSGLPGCRAIATASYSIAASHGYPDGERIPLDEMITAIGRIAAAVDLPVTADLEAGFGDAGTTVRRAIGAGAVGGNIEDQMRPLGEAVAAVVSRSHATIPAAFTAVRILTAAANELRREPAPSTDPSRMTRKLVASFSKVTRSTSPVRVRVGPVTRGA